MFLQAVNIKMLTTEYGPPEHWPDVIEAAVVELTPLSMTEALRKRYRFLDHIPLTCDFVLCEVDLSRVVSAETVRKVRLIFAFSVCFVVLTFELSDDMGLVFIWL